MEKSGNGKCRERVEVYARVVGFFRPVQEWNPGKQAEYHNRKTFKINKTILSEWPSGIDQLPKAV